MQPHTFITALLLLATLLVDAVAIKNLGAQVFPQPTAMLLMALGLAQTGIFAAWLVVGRLPLAGRFAGLLLTVMVLSLPLAKASAPNTVQWVGILTLYSAVIAFPLAGKRLVQPTFQARWQFSLRSLLAVTTGFAFVLGAARWVDVRDGNLFSLLSYCGGFGLVTLCAIWAATRKDNLIGSVAVISLACLPIGALVGAVNSPGDGPWIYTIMAFVQATAIILSLGALRLSGVFCPNRPPTAPSS